MDDVGRRPTLGRVVETLGPGMVDVLTWAGNADAEVHGPRIYDPLDVASIGQGDIVLAVSVAAPGDDARRLVDAAATAGATAVVFRAPDDVQMSGRIAVLRVSPAVTWDQLHSLLRNAVAASEAAPPEGEASPLGDLFALANAVAAMVGGAVSIEDPQSKVLAYSTLDHKVDEPRRDTILGHHVPEWWTARLREQGVFRRVFGSPGAIRFEDPEQQALPRLICAIRAGDEVLGTIWVIEAGERLGADAEQALTEAARVAALHLLRHQASEDLDRRERANLLRGLLEGTRAPVEATSVLGIDVDRPCTVMGFRFDVDDDAGARVKRARAVDLVTVYCEGFRRRAACTSIGDTVYVLLPSLEDTSSRGVTALASDIATHATDVLRVGLHAGIGSIAKSVHDVSRSRAEADRVLRVICGESDRRVVAHIDDVRASAILLELSDLLRDRPDLRLPALDALEAHDAQYSKAYVETLAAFLDAFGDVTTAARAINLHPNSFRYRLRRLGELSGIDLDNPDDRLVATLQLRLGDR